MTTTATHPIHRRYYAEDLVRLRRAGESRRYAGSQRRGRIDPNPHQIDAVMFALRRIPEGGCILADEVGLGKTIEAGLVIAQLLAEGAQRILIVVPRPLVGQWQNELYTLFRIDAHEASSNDVDLTRPGVFLAGREYAGGEKGSEALSNTLPFDLCIIDEAHEVFAGIHRRFDRHGIYDDTSRRICCRLALGACMAMYPPCMAHLSLEITHLLRVESGCRCGRAPGHPRPFEKAAIAAR